MRIERAAFAVLAVLALLSSYTLYVAASRFGDATDTFDQVEFELVDFTYERGSPEVEFTLSITNGGANDLRVVGFEYSYVVSGVLAGGGDDLDARTTIESGESEEIVLTGRITDTRYVNELPEDEPIDWLVRGRVLLDVDERLDNTWVGFAFRTESE